MDLPIYSNFSIFFLLLSLFTTIIIAIQYRIKSEDTEKAHFSLHKPHDQMCSYIENSVREFSSRITIDQIFESQN